MKKLVFVFVCALCIFPLVAQDEGIKFEDLTYPEALEKAKKEDKYLFVDCYTTWCVPCKYMSKMVFTQKAAGDYVSSRFVAVKYDMEKGAAIELSKKWKVQAYPTFLVIRPDGTIAHRIVGKLEWSAFSEKLERGLKPETSLYNLEERYKSGKTDNHEKMNYIKALKDASDTENVNKVSNELISSLSEKELLDMEYWPLINNNKVSPYGFENYKFIFDNRETVRKNAGEEELENYFYEVWSAFLSRLNHLNAPKNAFDGQIPENFVEQLQILKQQIAIANVKRKDFFLAKCSVGEAVLKKDKQETVNAIEAAFPLLPADDDGSILSGLSAIGKTDHKELADIYEKYLNALPNEKKPEWVKHNSLIYRKLAHTGVYFEPFTYEEALSWADKRWKQNVYIWGYISGDKVCHEMEENVFSLDSVGKVCNMVCVKYDLNSAEGKKIIEIYKLKDKAPIHLLLNSEGKEINRLQGSTDMGKFVDWIKNTSKSK
jgi:thiol-disulfide isomerase/thioredoxin